MAAVFRGGKSDGLPGLADDFILHRIFGGRLHVAPPQILHGPSDGPMIGRVRQNNILLQAPGIGMLQTRRLGTANCAAATGGPASVKLKLPEIAADGESTRLTQSSERGGKRAGHGRAGRHAVLPRRGNVQLDGVQQSLGNLQTAFARRVPLVLLARRPASLARRESGGDSLDRHQHGRRGGRIGVKRTHRPPPIALAAIVLSGLDIRAAAQPRRPRPGHPAGGRD